MSAGLSSRKAANDKCVGCRKVYGDAEQAQKSFDPYKNARISIADRTPQGSLRNG